VDAEHGKIQVSPSRALSFRSYDWIRGHVLKNEGHKLLGLRDKLERCWNRTLKGSEDRKHVENIIYSVEDRRYVLDASNKGYPDTAVLRRLDKIKV